MTEYLLTPSSSPPRGAGTKVVVIGYGNDLRGDDAAGRLAAAAVASWCLPGVEVISAHQLAPELSVHLACARLVIFVDATVTAHAAGVGRLEPGASPVGVGHMSDPRWLLGLTAALHGNHPEAWLVTVPARGLGLGESLSAAAAAGLEEALTAVRKLIKKGLSAGRG